MLIQLKLIVVYLTVMTLLGFMSMYIDKKRAREHKWRISEKTLFLIAILGGSIGTNLGMRVCRHKTKHWYFVVGMPMILVLQIAAVCVLWLEYL